jgi:nucleotide-binding universal stress UspA family protein
MAGNETNAVWAIDPTTNRKSHLLATRKALQAWNIDDHLNIQPISLVTPVVMNWPLEQLIPWENKLDELAEGSLKPLVKSFHMKNVADPYVAVDPSLSLKGSIKKFLSLAADEHADIIIATTHRRKGLGRYRIGSFTQGLIEKSTIPVLTVRPDSKPPVRFSTILFPTDFSKSSLRAFDRLLMIANKLRAKVILFHNAYAPILPTAEFALLPNRDKLIEDQYKQQIYTLEKKGERWKTRAEEFSVSVDFVLQTKSFTLSRAILNVATQKHADMIALSIESHPVARSILPSATREIIESYSKPVLVLNGTAGKEDLH